MRRFTPLHLLLLIGLLCITVSTVYASSSSPLLEKPRQDGGGDDDDEGLEPLIAEALISQRCVDCHSRRFLAGTEGTTRTPAEWAEAVDRMIDYGVFLSPEERTVVIEYLANQGPDALLDDDQTRMQASEYDALYADALVNLRCTGCHGRTLVAGVAPDSRGRDAWAATVDRMIDYGADVAPDERDVIIDYLSSAAPAEPDAAAQQDITRAEALVSLRCVECHSRRFLAGTAGTTRTPAEWAEAVDRMIDYGVILSDDERTLVIEYLASQSPEALLDDDQTRMQASEYDALYADALVNLRCTDCHGRTLVAGVAPDSRGRDAWTATVDRMIDYGADVAPDERDVIIDYLSSQ